MISVLLVDDEKLALEYLENIIDWEKLWIPAGRGHDRPGTGVGYLPEIPS